jgi:hypothetical protein
MHQNRESRIFENSDVEYGSPNGYDREYEFAESPQWGW